MRKLDKNFVGLDIGSAKVGVLIGQRDAQDGIEIVGKGSAPHRGTRRGNVVNVDATVEAIKQATEEAETMAGIEVSRAYVGVAGADIRSVNSRGMVYVARKDREITRHDIDRVLEAAQQAALPSDREILHAVPQEFTVDDQTGIAEPLGMLGSRLEVSVHLVTGHAARNKTLQTCVNRAGIEVIELVFEPLAAAESLLTPDVRELGSLLVDIGSGTTGFAVFNHGEIQHSAVVPVGGSHFTNDLAQVLRTPFGEAEKIKTRRGCCLLSLVGDDEGISVPSVGGGTARVVPRRELCEILQPRAEELFQLVREDLQRTSVDGALRGGVILTGGGAQLDGLLELAEQTFDRTVRYGLPRGLGGLVDVINSPQWATSSGLLRYAAAHESAPGRGAQKKTRLRVRAMVGSLRGMFQDLL